MVPPAAEKERSPAVEATEGVTGEISLSPPGLDVSELSPPVSETPVGKFSILAVGSALITEARVFFFILITDYLEKRFQLMTFLVPYGWLVFDERLIKLPSELVSLNEESHFPWMKLNDFHSQ